MVHVSMACSTLMGVNQFSLDIVMQTGLEVLMTEKVLQEDVSSWGITSYLGSVRNKIVYPYCRTLAKNEQSRHQYIYPIRERNIRKPNKGRNRVLRPENQGTGVGYARGRY